MRGALLVLLAAAIGVCAAAGAGATSSRSACGLGSKMVKGHEAVVYCGPATASLRIGGKTYSFKGGSCLWAGTLILNVGTQVNGIPDSANNEGAPLFQLTDAGGSAIVYAYSGRFALGLSLVQVTAHGHSSGTFKGRQPVGAALRFTGSYHC